MEPRIFVTSDLHFFHRNILKFNPDSRPWESVKEMNEALIDNWNSVVRPQDTVYNLGDFAFAGMSKIIPILGQLNGNHILIRGNHDGPFRKFQNLKKISEMNLLSGVYDYLEIKHNRQNVVMSHYSMRVWNRMHHGSFMLYGHSHGSLPGIGRSMDVGIDSSDMTSAGKPFLLDDVLEHLSQFQNVPIDHHKER